MMKRICSWCGVDLGEKPGPESKVTHGICDACEKTFNEEFEREISNEQKQTNEGGAEEPD